MRNTNKIGNALRFLRRWPFGEPVVAMLSRALLDEHNNVVASAVNGQLVQSDGVTPIGGSGTLRSYATDAAKLAGSANAFDLAKITGEGNRIEQLISLPASTQANWVVLRNTVNLTVLNAGSTFTLNGVSCPSGSTMVGWIDPTAITLAYAIGTVLIESSLGVYRDLPMPTGAIPYVLYPRAAITLFFDTRDV